MSIENEYLTLKKQLEVEHNKLLEYQAIEIVEDENNPFSIEERVNAKNRCINSCKESISELKEILAEVEDELREFIANGGEVSKLTIKELEEDSESSSKTNGDNMDWNMNDLNKFQSMVLKNKEDLMGEKINDAYVFAGAGQKCIKIESNDDVEFIAYDEVLNEETDNAKALFDFFFKEETVENDSSSENTTTDSSTIEIIPITGDDFETEIEDYMKSSGAGDDFMAYEGHTIASIGFRNNNEQLQYIIENCTVFEDNDKYYICQDDGTGDFCVQPVLKRKYEHIKEAIA